jgi:hypothetical protein
MPRLVQPLIPVFTLNAMLDCSAFLTDTLAVIPAKHVAFLSLVVEWVMMSFGL